MGYIENLRQKVGHMPLILAGAAVLIQNTDGSVLFQKRRDPVNSWGIPGGLMELRESPEDTAIREVREETGLIISDLKLLGVYSSSGRMSTAGNGDQYYPLTIAYVTSHFEGMLQVDPAESLDYQFFSLNELPKPLLKNHLRIVNDFISKLK
ncbi:NUDIX hydrolase [Sporolactobacillus vineae]|uniref:NUDIX hydrolase n=1 Tax=Sporolactobacillus vineae TaxID=444463 RepID=UPI000289D4DC|nr:NUDIX hydrolase [Sporolactobacillus vineae]